MRHPGRATLLLLSSVVVSALWALLPHTRWESEVAVCVWRGESGDGEGEEGRGRRVAAVAVVLGRGFYVGMIAVHDGVCAVRVSQVG